jgi:hypothetical protein
MRKYYCREESGRVGGERERGGGEKHEKCRQIVINSL